jgi:hypothetical protein
VSGFHPALTGVLYGVLAQNQQALAQLQLAANITQTDVDGETAERSTAIIDGLKRLIAMTEPSPARPLDIEVAEGMRRAYLLLGHLQEQLSEFDIWSWTCHVNEVDANLRADGNGNDAARATMRVVADRIGVDYVEKRHTKTGNAIIICAKGKINGVSVRIYDLIEAERPFCDSHHVMVDAAGVCLDCSAEATAHVVAQRAELHLDLSDEALAELALHAGAGVDR